MRRSFNLGTDSAWKANPQKTNYEEAFVYFVHVFPNYKRLDYDNRGRKFVIDALRFVGVIKDDNWRNIQLSERGVLSRTGASRVEVFVCDVKDKSLLIEHIDLFHVKTL